MYDLIILGGGPAGHAAADRAAAFGKSVLIIEEAEHLGGVCLNSGCIPTKSMLYSAKLYHHALHGAAFGVPVEGAAFDYAKVRSRTIDLQDKLRKGVDSIGKKKGCELIKGRGKLTGKRTVEVNGQSYEGANILIATGSRAFIPPVEGLKGNPKAVDNVGILAQETMPERLCIIGGGVIGLEFADLYTMAGKQVTVVEMLDHVAGNNDRELARTLQKAIESKGASIHLSARVTRVDGTTVFFSDKKGQEQKVEADLVLVATGRAVNIENIGLDAAGVDTDKRGIKVNDRCETNVPGIYAAGDVTGRWQLAHFASRQGQVAVHSMFGREDICRECAVPTVIYTYPEVASVGLTEDMAKEKDIEVKTAKLPLSFNGRYLAETNGERGLIKVVAGKERGNILGIHMIGPGVSEMISTAVTIIECELRAKDVEELIFPHPTIGEVMHDVMHALD